MKGQFGEMLPLIAASLLPPVKRVPDAITRLRADALPSNATFSSVSCLLSRPLMGSKVAQR